MHVETDCLDYREILVRYVSGAHYNCLWSLLSVREQSHYISRLSEIKVMYLIS